MDNKISWIASKHLSVGKYTVRVDGEIVGYPSSIFWGRLHRCPTCFNEMSRTFAEELGR